MLKPLAIEVPARVAQASVATTVTDLMAAKYGATPAVRFGLSVRAHSGSGSITLRDTTGETEAFVLSGVGDSIDMAFTEITAIDPGLVVKVFA